MVYVCNERSVLQLFEGHLNVLPDLCYVAKRLWDLFMKFIYIISDLLQGYSTRLCHVNDLLNAVFYGCVYVEISLHMTP
jgi:hypothetical protein